MRLGNVTVRESATNTMRLAPVAGLQQVATARLFRVTHDGGWRLIVAYAKFTDSIDVRCLEY